MRSSPAISLYTSPLARRSITSFSRFVSRGHSQLPLEDSTMGSAPFPATECRYRTEKRRNGFTPVWILFVGFETNVSSSQLGCTSSNRMVVLFRVPLSPQAPQALQPQSGE